MNYDNYFYSHDRNSYDLPYFDIFLKKIAVHLYEQLAVRLCLTSILTIALTGNNQRMWGGIAHLDIYQSSCNTRCVRPALYITCMTLGMT